MNLVIVHYHLRPGGIRRVIELATPHLLRELKNVSAVTLLTGEANDENWINQFAEIIHPVTLRIRVVKVCRYFSEQKIPAAMIQRRIRAALDRVFSVDPAGCLVWAHNLGIGRNLLLSQELTRICRARNITLVSHHHDLWFDNRWRRWPELRRAGFRNLAQVAATTFPARPELRHVGINSEDAVILQKHFGSAATLLPNPVPRQSPPRPAAVRGAERWLECILPEKAAPVWILPCRLLRRKNVAEALLLTRWLRPEAWLITTGGASSADELAYSHKLERTAQQQGWRLRLGVLQDDGANKPSVAELMAVSETVLLTSIQEGFGLPYLEAAAASRPLLARNLPNVAPDLRRFGFRLPQAYDEIAVSVDLFDWPAERRRQEKLFALWRSRLPMTLRKSVATPVGLEAGAIAAVPFSRLTLTAQLEVLAQSPQLSWERCVALNPFLQKWRPQAATGRLQVTVWPPQADRWLSGATYARKFVRLVRAPSMTAKKVRPLALQDELLGKKLCSGNLYPLLWAEET